MSPRHVLAASDKFRGTATSVEFGTAVSRAASACGWTSEVVAMSDGGEGLLDAFGGPNRSSLVTGPLGDPVEAAWRLDGSRAVIESATASGLALAGGADGNDPMAATSRGTGELLDAAVLAGATTVVLGLGGSACTDGGMGAVDALSNLSLDRLRDGSVELLVCCDVRTPYEDAGRVFGPQKGATPAQVEQLTERLRSDRRELEARFGVALATLPGGGAAGGLGGGLAAVGATLRPGFDVVAEQVGLAAAIGRADLVITGEGRLDPTSLDGKVVGGVAGMCARAGVPVVAVVGTADAGVATRFPVVSLVARCGTARATGDTVACIETVVSDVLAKRHGPDSGASPVG